MASPNKTKIVYKKTVDLIPYACNSRTHDEEQVAQIASSIQEFGFTNPILIDDANSIIAGHGRIMAAKRLDLSEVPCIVLGYLSDAQKKAYVIADNKLALNAGWDDELLSLELKGLDELDFDLSLIGFSTDELAELLALDENVEGLTDEDSVPEAPEEPASVLGDVWLLGNHRLMCGDSTSIDAVDKLINGNSSDMIFTDPPYGMSYGGDRGGAVGSTDGTVKKFGMILNDDCVGDDLVGLVRDSLIAAASHKKEGGAAYVCFPWRTYSDFERGVESAGLDIKSCIVWNKKSIGLGLANYRPQHEFIFYCSGEWYGDRAQSDVWSMGRDASTGYVHPTQKPVELIELAISNSSKSGDVIHDCFGGSGSTLIACEKTNRTAVLMELDPKYCDVIVTRWQEFTGKDATLESTGEAYSSVKESGVIREQ